MIWCVVEVSGLVQVGTDSKSVDLPRVDLAFDHEAVEAQPNIRTFPHIKQTPGAVLEFLPANAECDGARTCGSANLEEPCLKVELLFVDRTRAANPIRVQAALQLDKGANVFAVMDIEIEHVPFVEIGVHEGLLAPVVVSDLFPNFASFAAYG